MGDVADFGAQLVLAHIADVDPVDKDLSLSCVKKAGNEVDQGGLSAAGAADECSRFTRFCGKRDNSCSLLLSSRRPSQIGWWNLRLLFSFSQQQVLCWRRALW